MIGSIAFDDQFQAAVADARRTLGRLAEERDAPILVGEVNEWLKDRFASNLEQLRAGTALLCPHIGPSPMPVYTAAWATDHLVCAACVSLLQADGREETRCDRCRQPASPLYTGCAASGPVLMTYVLCGSCATASHL